jgi:hypothetical protein
MFIKKIQFRIKSVAADEFLMQLAKLVIAFRFQDAYISLTNELNELHEDELFEHLYYLKRLRGELRQSSKRITNKKQTLLKIFIKAIKSYLKIMKLYFHAFTLKNFYRIDFDQEHKTL